MQRRKYLAALGSAAAGGAAMMGTGAFNTVLADRTMSVNVAGDGGAYLSFIPSDAGQARTQNSNGAYADITGNTLEIQFDSNADVAGNGLNDDAVTRFYDVFEIKNRGANDVFIWVDGSTVPNGVSFINSNPPIVQDGTESTGSGLVDSQPPSNFTDKPPVPEPAKHFVPVGRVMDGISINVDTSAGGLTTGNYDVTFRAERKSTFDTGSGNWDTYNLP